MSCGGCFLVMNAFFIPLTPLWFLGIDTIFIPKLAMCYSFFKEKGYNLKNHPMGCLLAPVFVLCHLCMCLYVCVNVNIHSGLFCCSRPRRAHTEATAYELKLKPTVGIKGHSFIRIIHPDTISCTPNCREERLKETLSFWFWSNLPWWHE